MNRRLTISYIYLVLAGLALTQCAPPPKPPPVVTLMMKGSADQNPSTGGAPSPVAVKVFELTATAKFERADVFALTEREQQTLGTDSLGSQEFVLSPSEARTVVIEPKPTVQSIGVVALFRDIDQAQWRAVAPIATSGPTKLAVTIGKLSVTLKPAP